MLDEDLEESKLRAADRANAVKNLSSGSKFRNSFISYLPSQQSLILEAASLRLASAVFYLSAAYFRRQVIDAIIIYFLKNRSRKDCFKLPLRKLFDLALTAVNKAIFDAVTGIYSDAGYPLAAPIVSKAHFV